MGGRPQQRFGIVKGLTLDKTIGEKTDALQVVGLKRQQVFQGFSGLGEMSLLLVQQCQIAPTISGARQLFGELLQGGDCGVDLSLAALTVGPLQPAPQVIGCLGHRLGKSGFCLGVAAGAVGDAALLKGNWRLALVACGWWSVVGVAVGFIEGLLPLLAEAFRFLSPSRTAVVAATGVDAIQPDHTDGEPLAAGVAAEIEVVQMKVKAGIETNPVIQQLLALHGDQHAINQLHRRVAGPKHVFAFARGRECGDGSPQVGEVPALSIGTPMPTQVSLIAAVAAKAGNRKPLQLRTQQRLQGFRRQGQIVVAEQQDLLAADLEGLVVKLGQPCAVVGVDRAGQIGVGRVLQRLPQQALGLEGRVIQAAGADQAQAHRC